MKKFSSLYRHTLILAYPICILGAILGAVKGEIPLVIFGALGAFASAAHLAASPQAQVYTNLMGIAGVVINLMVGQPVWAAVWGAVVYIAVMATLLGDN